LFSAELKAGQRTAATAMAAPEALAALVPHGLASSSSAALQQLHLDLG